MVKLKASLGRLRQEHPLSLGVEDYPGPHSQTPSLKQNKRLCLQRQGVLTQDGKVQDRPGSPGESEASLVYMRA